MRRYDMKLTEELARMAAQDAGNRSMRKAHRKAWNEEDWNVAAETFDRLWPTKEDGTVP
jgi:hypothetical protein